MSGITLTIEEQKAIASLKRLAKRWPDSLSLFGWAGSLIVTKKGEETPMVHVADIHGIYCDGGDPSDDELDTTSHVEYEH